MNYILHTPVTFFLCLGEASNTSFHTIYLHNCLVAPLTWVSWVPWNPSIFEKLVPEPINFGKKGQKFAPFSVQNKQEIGVKTLKYFLGTHYFEFLTEPLHIAYGM